MYPELGQLALILALLLAVLLSVVPLAGSLTGRNNLQAFARPLASGVFVFVGLAFAVLTHAFVTGLEPCMPISPLFVMSS